MGGPGSGRKREMVEGQVPDLYDGRPHLIAGTIQRAGPVVPTACPHCRGAGMWATDARQGHCGQCGETFFKATEVATLRGPLRPPRPPQPA